MGKSNCTKSVAHKKRARTCNANALKRNMSLAITTKLNNGNSHPKTVRLHLELVSYSGADFTRKHHAIQS